MNYNFTNNYICQHINMQIVIKWLPIGRTLTIEFSRFYPLKY